MENKLIFRQNDPSIIHLKTADIQLSKLIHQIGDYQLRLQRDYFAALVRAIIGQQLSVKAAEAIWDRVSAICRQMSPEAMSKIPEEKLRDAGLSRAKALYIRELCEKLTSGALDVTVIGDLSEEEVIARLCSVKGIGRWTAEMFLIFSLGRLDVLSLDDIGLRRAVKWLYNLEYAPSVKEIKELGESWRPYRTIASLYLWEAINQDYVIMPPI